MSVTTLATPPKTGCKKFNFVGTFLSARSQTSDFSGDDTHVIHNLHFSSRSSSDGTVNQYWTGLPDYLTNAGTGSPSIGSWTCRDDGKLVIVWIQGSYFSDATRTDDPHISRRRMCAVEPFSDDVSVLRDDDNTLTRLQSRTRSYTPGTGPDGCGRRSTLDSTAITPSPLTNGSPHRTRTTRSLPHSAPP